VHQGAAAPARVGNRVAETTGAAVAIDLAGLTGADPAAGPVAERQQVLRIGMDSVGGVVEAGRGRVARDVAAASDAVFEAGGFTSGAPAAGDNAERKKSCEHRAT
jgi:hypothetical protein